MDADNSMQVALFLFHFLIITFIIIIIVIIIRLFYLLLLASLSFFHIFKQEHTHRKKKKFIIINRTMVAEYYEWYLHLSRSQTLMLVIYSIRHVPQVLSYIFTSRHIFLIRDGYYASSSKNAGTKENSFP